MGIDLEKLSGAELIKFYGDLIVSLKEKGVIRSKNVVGDIGEYLALEYYNNTRGCAKLQRAPTGTTNVDALSRDGKRYSIKATTGNTTGVFHGLPDPKSEEKPEKNFEFVIIVKLDGNYSLKCIVELTWEQFFIHKKWHSRVKAWNLVISKALLKEAKTVYDSDSP
jgi:hypothetical protein